MWRGGKETPSTVSPRQLTVTRCPNGEEAATLPHGRRELKPRSWGQDSALCASTQHTSHPVAFLGALSCREGPQGRVLGGSEAGEEAPVPVLHLSVFYFGL